MLSPEFLITALIVVIAPGTGVIYTLAVGLGAGRTASVAAAFGCTLGILPAMTAAVIGVSSILYASALLFAALKICGVVYLLYLAWLTLRETGPLAFREERAEGRSWFEIARTGMLINVLNPKLAAFFTAFLPQFVDVESEAASLQFASLGGVFMAMTFGVFVLYGVFASAIRNYVLSRPNLLVWVRRTVAASFAAFAARLAVAER